MDYYLNGCLSIRFGIKEALILDVIYKDIKRQEEYGEPAICGGYWCRISHKMLSVKLPMLTKDMAKRTLEHLVNEGVILKSEYNRSRFDRTASYSFTEYGQVLMKGAYEEKHNSY